MDMKCNSNDAASKPRTVKHSVLLDWYSKIHATTEPKNGLIKTIKLMILKTVLAFQRMHRQNQLTEFRLGGRCRSGHSVSLMARARKQSSMTIRTKNGMVTARGHGPKSMVDPQQSESSTSAMKEMMVVTKSRTSSNETTTQIMTSDLGGVLISSRRYRKYRIRRLGGGMPDCDIGGPCTLPGRLDCSIGPPKPDMVDLPIGPPKPDMVDLPMVPDCWNMSRRDGALATLRPPSKERRGPSWKDRLAKAESWKELGRPWKDRDVCICRPLLWNLDFCRIMPGPASGL
mmetsp:Transcript_9963/g.28299  ORF Transcript_9963/g.28299 Transcript_9963/m.28299 type:complete len:287 (-) Transcript_9963:1181-2041(-)